MWNSDPGEHRHFREGETKRLCRSQEGREGRKVENRRVRWSRRVCNGLMTMRNVKYRLKHSAVGSFLG